MTPFRTVAGVFAAIQTVKAGAAGFCTNFFPDGQKLQDWVERNELHGESCAGALFLFRRDHDFSRLYFCAASPAALRAGIATLAGLRNERIVVDLVGKESAPGEIFLALEAAGFRRYQQLCRMARPGQSALQAAGGAELPVTLAGHADVPAILALLEGAFDRYAEQLPLTAEIENAVASGQIFVVRLEGVLAGLLFFETQGVTSILRYWLVAEAFRARHVGAALMRHYLATQSTVRRFLLWVIASNDNAVQKYRRYGFVPDGLVDHVLASEPIYNENHR
ncbi:MAG: GNAT family N-acetyltransferase [Verrucomicrobiales bacterium]|nr:GNAT family N-acetyltransferase [Verrucomicrobiales bacterium]